MYYNKIHCTGSVSASVLFLSDSVFPWFLDIQVEEEPESRGGRRRTWDDEHVLKRQFSALVPAFDPRPGRTNIAQTQDIVIPAPGKMFR